jgi:polysaccharide biosynthesis protein PslH
VKLLFVTPYLPSPPRSGGSARLHGLLTNLARTHDVTILSFVDPADDYEPWLEATREYCDEVVVVENDLFGITGRRKRLAQLRSLASTRSYERFVYHRPEMQQALDDLTGTREFDIITAEFSLMGYYTFPESIPLLVDEHNIEYDILRRTFRIERGFQRKVYNYANYRKLLIEERAIWRRASGISLTSQRDERVLRRYMPEACTAVVPNGVDTTRFTPRSESFDAGSLVFFGAISYYPNTDGLIYFRNDILPLLRERFPEVRLTVVGPAPPPDIATWVDSDELITVSGFVDDVRPYLAQANVVIVPLRIGGGTRLKILEAMSMGKAVVSTRIGAEGIDVSDGQDILLADSPRDFAERVGFLIANPDRAEAIGTAARELMVRRYDWRASVARLEQLFERVMEDHQWANSRH